MQIDLATADEDLSQQLLEDAAAAETVPVLQVRLPLCLHGSSGLLHRAVHRKACTQAFTYLHHVRL